MIKSKRTLVLSLAVAVMLTLGLATAIFAADPPATPPASTQTLPPMWQKVAQILGVSEQNFKDALTKAQTELFNERIDKALADKKITEQQAEKLRQQYQERLSKSTVGPGWGGCWCWGAGPGGQMGRGKAGGPPFGRGMGMGGGPMMGGGRR